MVTASPAFHYCFQVAGKVYCSSVQILDSGGRMPLRQLVPEFRCRTRAGSGANLVDAPGFRPATTGPI